MDQFSVFRQQGKSQDDRFTREVSRDGLLLPHARTFSGLLNTFTKVYSFAWDEAVRNGRSNAAAMDLDAYLRALEQERYIPGARWGWELAPDPDDEALLEDRVNPKDPKSNDRDDAVRVVSACLRRTPAFTELKRLLLLAGWYGRYGVQTAWAKETVAGQLRHVFNPWRPIHGDKIQFTYDGVPGVMVRPGDIPKGYETRLFDGGSQLLMLNSPALRERVVIHQGFLEDADYFEPDRAGRAFGVGYRDYCYWAWWLRQEFISWMCNYMEKVGTLGLLLFYYDAGSPGGKEAAEELAKGVDDKNALAVPRSAVPAAAGQKAVELIPASIAGSQHLIEIITAFFERHIERLLVGQSMSGGADNESGLGGTGRAELARNTKFQLLAYDAERLDETLTRDLVGPCQRLNVPDLGVRLLYKAKLPDPEAEAKLEAIAKAASLPGKKLAYKADEVRELIGVSAPGEGDEVVGGDEVLPGQGEVGPDGLPVDPTDPDGGGPVPAEVIAAVGRAASAGDLRAVDQLIELGKSPDALADLLGGMEAGDDPGATTSHDDDRGPPDKVQYEWSPATSAHGAVKAVWTGPGQRKPLYGKDAEAALRAKTKGPEKPVAGAAKKAKDWKQGRAEPARATAREVWAKAVADPTSVQAHELEQLGHHLRTLTRDEVRVEAKKLEHATFGKVKEHIVRRLLEHVGFSDPRQPSLFGKPEVKQNPPGKPEDSAPAPLPSEEPAPKLQQPPAEVKPAQSPPATAGGPPDVAGMVAKGDHLGLHDLIGAALRGEHGVERKAAVSKAVIDAADAKDGLDGKYARVAAAFGVRPGRTDAPAEPPAPQESPQSPPTNVGALPAPPVSEKPGEPSDPPAEPPLRKNPRVRGFAPTRAKSISGIVKQLGGIDPQSEHLKSFFSGRGEAQESGVPKGVFRAGGQGLDELAQEMVTRGDIFPPEGVDPSAYLIDLLKKRSKLGVADQTREYQEAEKEFYDALAAAGHAGTYNPDATAAGLFGPDADPGVAEAVRSGQADAQGEVAAEDVPDLPGEPGGDDSFEFGANAPAPDQPAPAAGEQPAPGVSPPAGATRSHADDRPMADPLMGPDKQLDIFGTAKAIPRPARPAVPQSLIPREVERKVEGEETQKAIEGIQKAGNPDQIRLDDLPALAAAVHHAAGSLTDFTGQTAEQQDVRGYEAGRHKVFISKLYDALAGRLPPGTTLDAFKRALVEASRADHLDLGRNDLPQTVPADDFHHVARSDTRYLNGQFHVVNVPGSKLPPAPAGNPGPIRPESGTTDSPVNPPRSPAEPGTTGQQPAVPVTEVGGLPYRGNEPAWDILTADHLPALDAHAAELEELAKPSRKKAQSAKDQFTRAAHQQLVGQLDARLKAIAESKARLSAPAQTPASPEQVEGDEPDDAPPVASSPTAAKPGSPEKIAEMEARVKAGLQARHPLDATKGGPAPEPPGPEADDDPWLDERGDAWLAEIARRRAKLEAARRR